MDSLSRRLLAHRGLWTESVAPNSLDALVGAAKAGFGIETDIRDADGGLVISHDPATSDALHAWTALSAVAAASSTPLVLALNVKADGLLSLLDPVLEALAPHASFFFDMSVPQLLTYARRGLPVAVRVSEYEPLRLDLFDEIGVPTRLWLDGFDSDWWLSDPHIKALAGTGSIAVVSPELHGRDPGSVWEWFLAAVARGEDVYLCTDEPFRVLELAT